MFNQALVYEAALHGTSQCHDGGYDNCHSLPAEPSACMEGDPGLLSKCDSQRCNTFVRWKSRALIEGKMHHCATEFLSWQSAPYYTKEGCFLSNTLLFERGCGG
eukprot:786139-Pelagomonas_calceolata.AAC.9